MWQTTSGLAAILFFHKNGQNRPNRPKNLHYRTYNDRICSFRFCDLFYISVNLYQLNQKHVYLKALNILDTNPINLLLAKGHLRSNHHIVFFYIFGSKIQNANIDLEALVLLSTNMVFHFCLWKTTFSLAATMVFFKTLSNSTKKGVIIGSKMTKWLLFAFETCWYLSKFLGTIFMVLLIDLQTLMYLFT